jgi:hypothetical protein
MSTTPDHITLGYINVHGLGKQRVLSKWASVRNYFESSSYHLLFVAEDWFNNYSTTSADPVCVGHSPFPPRESYIGGRIPGGVMVLAKPAIRAGITSIRSGLNWVSVSLGEITIAGVYFPPSWGKREMERALMELGHVDVLCGDVNVDFHMVAGMRNSDSKAAARRAALQSWSVLNTAPLQPYHGNPAKLDHVFARPSVECDLLAIPKDHLPFKTDHPLIKIALTSQVAPSAQSNVGARRYNVRRLDHATIEERFRKRFEHNEPLLLAACCRDGLDGARREEESRRLSLV